MSGLRQQGRPGQNFGLWTVIITSMATLACAPGTLSIGFLIPPPRGSREGQKTHSSRGPYGFNYCADVFSIIMCVHSRDIYLYQASFCWMMWTRYRVGSRGPHGRHKSARRTSTFTFIVTPGPAAPKPQPGSHAERRRSAEPLSHFPFASRLVFLNFLSYLPVRELIT